ncbi:MAG: NAD(P)H-dependent oxidoreductase [Alphaproteobacteria bacterium]|nr:NAD(P)H-dependent oxidoreductase [Alphaproteobacteria bacterium]MBO4643751.1 NAD(P)H-dependent oxidoreductase [Alphaproteobacteria bacterium]
MKYVLGIILTIIVIGGIAGLLHLYRVSAKNKKEMAQYADKSAEVTNNLGKVLVVYYSLTGHTKDIAEKIAAKTNADLFEIKTKEPYPTGAKLYTMAKKEIKNKQYPAIEAVPNVTDYDVIFVGAPVWWYTMAPPLFTVLEQVDFQGKKVVPFSTQGSNIGKFFEDFAATAKNATVLQRADFNNMDKKYDKQVEAKIADWINGL